MPWKASWDPSGALLAANFALLARSWTLLDGLETLLGRSWDALGTLLGRSWVALGSLLHALGRSWPLLGRSWDALGTLLGRCWSLLAALGRPRDPLGTFLARFRTSNTRFWTLRSYVKRLLSNPSARLADRYLHNSCTMSRKKPRSHSEQPKRMNSL